MTDATDTEPNEIMAAVAEAKAHAHAAADAVVDRTRNWPLARISLGVSIGSAAIAAAVLYASRNKDR